MMTSLAQAYSPHPGGMQQQHPGMAQGHPMAVQHNPGQQGQPGPGMQQMQMGASGPGPQVSQGAVMMGGMPPGAAGPSQHALHHLNPNAQQQFMQQQLFAGNPQLQMQQQAMRQQAQAQRQAMLAQQYSGMPMGMQNGMNQMTQAQYHAMRGNPMARPVNLPQHLQQQQQQVAEHSLQQQQQQQHAAQQHHHQHQILLAQQLAIQQQAGNNNPGQPQMNPQHQNAQAQAAMMQQQQQQQQQAQAAAAAQQNQGQPQAQAQSQQPQQPQQNSQPQAQQPQQVPQQQQQAGMQQQQAVHAAMLQRQQGEKYKGQCLMKLMQFSDHLSQFGVSLDSQSLHVFNKTQRRDIQVSKQREDLAYWSNFVERFFSTKGVLRHSVWLVDETSNKQYEITFPALARYFHTHFESGIRNMQMVMERGTEKDLGNGHYVESPKSSFVYWFDNGSQLVANGTLKAHFDVEQKIELLEFITSNHEEYIPRNQVLNAARPMHEWGKEWHKVNSPLDGKQSPEMNKKKAKTMKSPPQPPPEFDIPESKVKSSMGITPAVFRYLEFAEVLGMMNPLFNYSHQHPALSPPNALEQYVSTIATNAANPNGQQQNPSGPRTPGMGNFQSPGVSHLNLPDGPSPRASPAQAPGMQLQQSQHGTNSSGPSANTSPNTNKRRRPSTVKAEEEIAQQQLNGTKTAVKPSPRIGGKRQKGNPA
ncbi:Topoisomerase II-associated protein PAT1 [Diplocarpon rosae]|nr:Topoisomerase II-associated protein PAT1 [Diplocarpon rosae]